MTNSVYFDLTAVLQDLPHAIEQPLDWPISPQEFQEFANGLGASFLDVLGALDDDLFDITLADSRFFLSIIRYAHFSAAYSSCLKEGKTRRCSPAGEIELSPDWQAQSEYYYQSIKKINALKAITKSIIKTCNEVSLLDMVKNYSSLRQSWCLGYDYMDLSNPYIKQYKEKSGQLWLERDWDELFIWQKIDANALNYIDYTATNRIDEFVVTPVLQSIKAALPDIFDNNNLGNIRQSWIKRLRHIHIIYNLLATNLNIPQKVIVAGGNNPFRKLLTLFLQRAGTAVYGFYHGLALDGAIADNFGQSFSVSHFQNYVLPTHNLCDRYSKQFGQCSVGKQSNIQYLAHQSIVDAYPRFVYRRNNVKKLAVCYVGYPMNHHRYFIDPSLFFSLQFNLETQLLTYLISKGVTVAYKPHPDRLRPISSIYEKIGIPVVTGDFEKVLDSSDALIFSNPTSTTFGRALFSEKEIVLFDTKFIRWDPTLYKLLEKRCHILTTSVENSLSPVVLNNVYTAVTNLSTKSDNTEFLAQYFFEHS
jgi:hypothetical protein